jgi:RHS repeat-associated protein
MLSDKNKGISSVQYNHQNLPVKITVTGKGEIEYIYDADGSKLQKIVRETGKPEKLTTYIGGFVYEKIGSSPEALQYTLHPEGRVRVITPVGNVNQPNFIGGGVGLPDGKQGVYDYYITDHLGNVRMILSEEQHKAGDVCTMEETDAQIKAREEGQFGNPGAGNEVVNSRVNTPAAWRAILPADNTIKERVSKLSAQGQKTGPNVLLKVMAGDLLHVKADYFYEGSSFSGSGTPVATLVNGLLTALMSDKGSQLGKAFRTDVSTQLNATQPLTDLLSPQGSGGVVSVPHAYINYIFFDEQFNYAGGDFVRVNSSGNGTAPIARTNIRVPKNGWVYAYLSNESNEAVYFDNFAVTHERGRILEESHYYPYGLKIAAISSRAEGKAENKYLYNGKELASGEFEDGSGLDWYEYGMREYDAQIGRFFRIDPLTDEYPYLTPYQYAGCEPIANVDMDGLEPLNVIRQSSAPMTPATWGIVEAAGLVKQIQPVVVTNTITRLQSLAAKISPTVVNTINNTVLQRPMDNGLRPAGFEYYRLKQCYHRLVTDVISPRVFEPNGWDKVAAGNYGKDLRAAYQVADGLYVGVQALIGRRNRTVHISGHPVPTFEERFLAAIGVLSLPTMGLNAASGEVLAANSMRGTVAEAVVEGMTTTKGFNPSAFADEIVAFNRMTEGEGVLMNGHPVSAINSAMYYETPALQGAAIFRSISHGHMFLNGNKRTAVAAFQLFAKQHGIKTVSKSKMMNIANKVATGTIEDVSQIANMLTR